jgi:HCOMODA/2-hydroxy-3-carboxy-muconic semialdehyde decarboxylase
VSDYETLLDDLVAANHILFHHGVVDAFGHVSARDPRDPGRFLLARHVAPALVTRDDIVTFDLAGRALDANGRKLYSELWIHAAIYAARPEVKGVVHSHSPAIIPFGVTDASLEPIFHMSAFLGEGVARFDTRDRFGETDLLIRDMERGRALATTLGSRPVSLMRGHGAVAVGVSLREAVYRAIYTEQNARLQSEAMRLGSVRFLTAGEAAAQEGRRDPTYRRAWELWLRAAERDGA